MRESKFNARRLRDTPKVKGFRLALVLNAFLGITALVLVTLGVTSKLGYNSMQEPLLVIGLGLSLLLVSLFWAERLRKRRIQTGPLQFSPDLLKKRH